MRSPRIALKPAAARGLKAWAALEGKEPTAILEGLVMANLPAKVKELLGEPGGQGLKEPMSPGLLEPGSLGAREPRDHNGYIAHDPMIPHARKP